MMDLIKIRMVMPEDKDSLEELMKNIVNELGEEFIEKRFQWGMLRRLYDPLQRHGIFVAETKDTKQLVGMIFGELRIDPFGVTECNFKRIYVEPDYRGKDIGHILLDNAINHLKTINVKKVSVRIHQNSVNTKKLFESFKFLPIHSVMELNLDDD